MTRSKIAFCILLSSVLLVDCGSKMLGNDELGSEASAIDATTSIVATQATNGITPGETSGDFRVTESGQASYTVPLWTPDGPMGMAPSLALQYDSSGGDSESLGVGFSLTGNVISKITRCRKTLAADSDVGPIKFDGNTYCLDGQRLIPVTNSTTDYRTRLDDGSKIVRQGPDYGPTGFTVYRRNGQILTYGFDPNAQGTTAQLKGVIKPTTCQMSACDQVFAGQTQNATLAWALETVTDRVAQIPGAVTNGIGNRMKLTYTTLSSGSLGTKKYFSDFDFKEMLLTQIDYGFGASGSTSHRKVVFTYNTTRADARYTWVNGLPIMSTKLLSQVDMYGPNPSSTQILKTYKLAYDAITTVSKRSRLKRIQECDNGPSVACKATTEFTWEAGSNNFVDVVDPTPRSMDKASTISVMDYNGDGKTDVYLRSASANGNTNVQFYTSQMAGIITPSTIPSNPIRLEAFYFPSNLEALVLGVAPFDLDGDSRPDLMLAASPGSLGGNAGDKTAFDLYRNIGNGFTYVTDPYPPNGLEPASPFPALVTPVFADLDGNGLAEIIQPGTVKTLVAGVPDGNSQLVFRRNIAGTLTGRTALTDTDRNESFTIQTDVQYHPLGNGLYYPFTGWQSYTADIDGSRRKSLLIRESWFRPNISPPTNSAGYEMLAILTSNTGVVTSTRSTLSAKARGSGASHYFWIDVNGDGLPDAIDVSNSTSTATTMAKASEETHDGISTIRINTGAGFKRFEGSFSTANPGTKYVLNTREDAGVMVADMNQDGLDDIVLMGEAVRNGVTDRSTVQVLIASTGTTATDHVVAGLPLRTPDNAEIPAAVPLNKGTTFEASVPATLGDFNGDGLVDIVIARPATASTVNLHFYIRQGKKADQLTAVDTGTGRHLSIEYAPVSDPLVYKRLRGTLLAPGEGQTGPWEQPSECGYQQNCLTGGMWVVSGYDVTNDRKLNAGHALKYAEGRMPTRFGWVGFAEKYDLDETDNILEATSYDNRTSGSSDRYPFAFRPAQVSKIVWDNGITGSTPAPGTPAPHRFLTTNHYQQFNNIFTPFAFSVRLSDSGTVEEILNGVPYARLVDQIAFDTTTYSSDEMANATTYFTYDQFDNITSEKRINVYGDTFEKSYSPTSDASTWLIGKVISAADISTTRSFEQVTHNHTYTYYPNTLLLNTDTVQAAGGNALKSVITYTRGAGALGQVTQTTTTATSTADDISVPTGTVLTRTVTTTYDGVDGVTVASVTNPLNQKTLLAYHGGLGVLAQSQDPNGVVTSYEYDRFGRIRKRSVPTEGVFTVDYEGVPTMPSLIASTVAALGPNYAEHFKQVGGEETIVTYNMNGRELVRQTKAGDVNASDGAYRYVLTRYRDTPGRVAAVSKPFRSGDTPLRETFFTYDSMGRIVDILNPDSTRKTFSYAPRFGPLGFVTTIIDELGHVRQEARNDTGQIESVSILDHFGGTITGTTSYAYGPFDLLKAVSAPSVVTPVGTKGAGLSITYDELGRRIQLTDGDSGPNNRFYNAFGDVVKEVDAMGIPTLFKRDALGRVKEKSNARDGVNTWVWDTATKGVGKLQSSTSFDGTTITNTFDTYGRPNDSTWSVQGRSYKIKQTYDVTTGKVSQIDYPTAGTTGASQLKVKYAYDSAGHVLSVTPTSSTTPYWKATHWWADGRVDRENDATNQVTTRVYDDNRSWLKSIKTAAGTNTIQNVVYLHDAVGNVYDRHDNDATLNTAEAFTYDENDQLKTWSFTSSSGAWSTDYKTQPSGVIQQTKTGPGAQSMVYDYFGSAASQLPHAVRNISAGCTPSGACSIPAYDAKGRQANTVTGLSLDYSAFDLPKNVSDLNGNPIASYKYDAMNNRVYKSYNGQTTASIAGLYERRVSSTGVVSHVMYIRGPGKRVVAQENWTESGSSVTKSPVLFHHDDIVGSTVVTNSTAGTTRLRYDPFGLRIHPKNLSLAPAAPPTKIGFTGHEMDDELNLINMKGRMYDPKIARFLTPDPTVSAPTRGNGYDRYGYALNNPLLFTDPSGFSAECPVGEEDAGAGYGCLPTETVRAIDPTTVIGRILDRLNDLAARAGGGGPGKGYIRTKGVSFTGYLAGLGPLVGAGGSLSWGYYYGWQNGPRVGVWGTAGGTVGVVGTEQGPGVLGHGASAQEIEGTVNSTSALEGGGGEVQVDFPTGTPLGASVGAIMSNGETAGAYGGLGLGVGTSFGAHAWETQSVRFGL